MSEQTDTSTTLWIPKLGVSNDPYHPFNKQWDVFNSRARVLLVCGSRKSGKTWATIHRVVRHLWETPGARVAMFAKSVKLAKDGGVWQDLMDIVIPEWIAGGFGFEFTTMDSKGIPGPKQDSQTRTLYFRVRNIHGGESELKLFSINNDEEVASSVLGKRFSMVYFSELSMFKTKRILTITLAQLRMPHLNPKPGEPDENHMWIADTNPDEDLGNRSWFYEEFYKERNKKRDVSIEKEAKKEKYYKRFSVIELFSADNPYLSQEEIEELEISCEGDPALYDAYVLGIHGDGGQKRNKLFAKFFHRSQHVIGGGDGEGDQIDVAPMSTTLYCGWDLGNVNHAAIALDKRFVLFSGVEKPVWSVLDELVVIGEEHDLKLYAKEFLDLMDKIEEINGRKFYWMHWSDDSAMNVWRPSSASYDYMEIQAGSFGRINLQGVVKPDGSIRSRCRLLQNLLKEGRLLVSSRCVKVIAMLESCRRGDTDKEYVNNDEFKHPFDALTYPIYMETLDDLARDASRVSASQRGAGSQIIGV